MRPAVGAEEREKFNKIVKDFMMYPVEGRLRYYLEMYVLVSFAETSYVIGFSSDFLKTKC